MPPRKAKTKLSRLGYQDITEKHGIRLKGPVPPEHWPEGHKHHFNIIRNIAFIRYELYNPSDQEQRMKYRQRTHELRTKAFDVLAMPGANEDTWRKHFEGFVSRPFEEDVLCARCKGEVRRPGFEANPVDVSDQTLLDHRRNVRRKCDCNSNPWKHVTRPGKDNEDPAKFSFAAGMKVSHCPEDDLEHIHIHMSPDRTVGLRCTVELKHCANSAPPHLDHFPVKETQILYPFLVIEAKKEQNAPGFRAVQYQTAFPIRRLLRIQNELKASVRKGNEPSLVWFLAYQGEDWRLYAGTMENSEVGIYDLWHGSVESQDGALQLLLIVDYIWSWARDIYHPSVKNSLCTFLDGREASVASSHRPRYSISTASTATPSPIFGEEPPIDCDGNSAYTFGHEYYVQEPCEMNNDGREDFQLLRDATSHPFLKWANSHRNSPSWTQVASIRHPNIIRFSLRVIMDTELDGIFFSHYSFLMQKNQLLALARFWTNASPPSVADGIPEALRVTLLYNTFCDQTWQIERAIICICWPCARFSSARDGAAGQPLTSSFLEEKLMGLQQIRGWESLLSAKEDTILVFSPSPDPDAILDENMTAEWRSFDDNQLASERFVTIREANDGLLNVSNLSIVCQSRGQGAATTAPTLELGPRGEQALIVFRSQRPKYCLFIFLEKNYDNPQKLYELLKEAVTNRRFHGDANVEITSRDRQEIRDWLSALKNA